MLLENPFILIFFLLLILFQIKHFLCDYPLQGEYMLGKFKGGKDWILPLLAHAGVHGVATFLISWIFIPWYWALQLGVGDLLIHFTVDRIKASPSLLGRFESLDKNCFKGVYAFAKGNFKATGLTGLTIAEQDEKMAWGQKRLKENKYFWWALGADQFAHHITHYFIIYKILTLLVTAY